MSERAVKIESRYSIEPEDKTFAIYQLVNDRRMFVGRYLSMDNAKKHVARLKEKWG